MWEPATTLLNAIHKDLALELKVDTLPVKEA